MSPPQSSRLGPVLVTRPLADRGRIPCPTCGRDVAWSRRAPEAPTRIARHKKPNTNRRKPRGSPGGAWCDKKVFDWKTDARPKEAIS